MKYRIGDKLEFNTRSYIDDQPNNKWIPCIIAGETTRGNSIIELLNEEPGWRSVFEVTDRDKLRPAKTRTEWWSRFAVSTDGAPFAIPFRQDREAISSYKLLDSVWHGEAFSIIVETEKEELPNG